MEHTVHDLIKHISTHLMPRYHDKILVTQYAWWMLEEITNRTQLELILHDSLTLTAAQQKKLDEWINAQVQFHEPLAYVIGWIPFMDFKIICKAPTLIPRPETEEWCDELIKTIHSSLNSSRRTDHNQNNFINNHSDTILKRPVHPEELSNHFKILDLCTGSGCIAIALARAFPDAHITATDIADSALALAQENAVANAVKNIEFVKSDVYQAVNENKKFDIIISNPPYIAPEEWKSLDRSVSQWEDPQALEAPDHGLAIIKKIIDDAPEHLTPKHNQDMPRLIIEIGYQQGPVVKQLMEAAGFKLVEIKKDLAGKDRTVWGYLS